MGSTRSTMRPAMLAVVILSLVAAAVIAVQPDWAPHTIETISQADSHSQTNSQNNNSPGEESMSTAESKSLSHGRVEHAELGSFEQKVLQSSVPVLVDFYADWCGPCRMIAPVLDDVAREVPGARVVKVNVDHNPELASTYGISSIPSLMVFKDGEVIARHVGVASKDRLKNLLTR